LATTGRGEKPIGSRKRNEPVTAAFIVELTTRAYRSCSPATASWNLIERMRGPRLEIAHPGEAPSPFRLREPRLISSHDLECARFTEIPPAGCAQPPHLGTLRTSSPSIEGRCCRARPISPPRRLRLIYASSRLSSMHYSCALLRSPGRIELFLTLLKLAGIFLQGTFNKLIHKELS
jgi:hypothetical protein